MQHSFTFNRVQIGVVNGHLYAFKLHFLPHPLGARAPNVELQLRITAWSLMNGALIQFLNVTLSVGSLTRFERLKLFNTSKRESCYIIYLQKLNLYMKEL